ncbi:MULTISPECIES: Crp/Fnr family transcriptional regulator [Paenibacillus]|uniref:Crp/Fnr family transcriptional regulator n=1 Tax=Paenibacillus TaxID=44249 RepID=UPI00020D66E7|nr:MULTISPECIES: Crp/Fnr family transcriptional regulator [Paenibacillus]EGL16560.1 cyclic nucleotide-binding domain protein [Paenibacillus sp. HGF7]EPD90247.1 hypothetical protein HMPREF1207_01033 [Paenibacillus sp. HGH0039]MBV6712626.1 Crp/Fnr family transcriptional regulator [Paenibacillus chitinolyticus]
MNTGTNPVYYTNPRNTAAFKTENLQKLTDIMHEQKLQPGAYLFWEGDTADKLYFIKNGRVRATKSTDEGKDLVLYLYQQGDLIGMIDPYDDTKHWYSAEVLEETLIGVAHKKDVEMLIWQSGEFALEFMRWMGLSHRMTQTKYRDMMLYGKPGALCSTIIRLSNTYGRHEEDGTIRITKKLTHSELSDMIGSTRESVNRMFSDLRKAQAIEMDNGYIIIRDLNYLKGICHCENCPVEVCRM